MAGFDATAVLSASPTPTLVSRSSDRRVLWLNAAAQAATGRGEEGSGAVGATLDELGVAGEGTQTLRTPGLPDRPVRVVTAPVELAGLPCLVSQLHEAEQVGEARFRQLAESIHQGVVLRDVDAETDADTYVYVSPAFERITGVSWEELRADPERRLGLIHPADRDRVRGELHAAADHYLEISYRIVRPDGAVRWVLSKSAPVFEGGLRRVAAVVEDVTEARENEESLRDARSRAEKASLAKSEFLSRMSHELRTPLNAIVGFSQLLEMDELSQEHAEAVDYVLRAGRHLLDLVNEVLDIARIESGRPSLSLEPVDLGEVLSESLGLVRPMAAEQRVRLPSDAEVGGSGLFVHADRQRVKQVFLNLLTNAVKYNRPDGSVHVACLASGADRMRVTVSDTGAGFPAEQAERLFTPFDRLDADTSGVEGTGLGLALSQRLVQAMGGELSASSEVGQGAQFVVELSAATAPRTHPHREGDWATAGDAGQGASKLEGLRVPLLYVEDNLANVRLLERVASRRAMVNLIVAMQGSAALDLARQHRPALVLLDMHLPDLSGLEVLGILRSDPRTVDIPVAILSADASPAQIERAMAAGATEYLTKPLELPRLLAVIDAAMASASR